MSAYKAENLMKGGKNMSFFDVLSKLADSVGKQYDRIQEKTDRYYEKYSSMSGAELKSIYNQCKNGQRHLSNEEVYAFKKVCRERGYMK